MPPSVSSIPWVLFHQQRGAVAEIGRRAGQHAVELGQRIADPHTKLPFSKIRKAMGNLYPVEQAALSESSADQRLTLLGELDRSTGPVFMRAYAGTMIPAACTPASVQRLQSAIDKLTDLSAGARRALLVAHQEDQRCVVIKKTMKID